MTGVSQATVSLVLNGRDTDGVRIAPDTRNRVLRVIEETGYVADPIARRLLSQQNRIIGVFTYEAVFPAEGSDFYRPFLMGIEQQAERAGCDLLLLTSAPVIGGRRHIFHKESRIRLADGLILLGRSLDPGDLSRLVTEGPPFVSVGRRDDAGGRVPYVGADYATAVAALVRRAAHLGHPRIGYVGQGAGAESYADRMTGYLAAARAAGVTPVHENPAGRSARDVLDSLLAAGVTAVFAEEHPDAVALATAAEARGLTVPGGLSIVTMLQPPRETGAGDREFTGIAIPRQQMGSEALEMLSALIAGTPVPDPQRLLPCEPVEHGTLAAPAPRPNGR
jgi:DNA-binding LacI/PurR family transcriptional regulator